MPKKYRCFDWNINTVKCDIEKNEIINAKKNLIIDTRRWPGNAAIYINRKVEKIHIGKW